MLVGNVNPWWRGKRSRHSRLVRKPQFYVSDKRSMPQWVKFSESKFILVWGWQRTHIYTCIVIIFVNNILRAGDQGETQLNRLIENWASIFMWCYYSFMRWWAITSVNPMGCNCYSCPNFSDDLATAALKLGQGWVISCYTFVRMQLLTHALIKVRDQLT